MQYETDLFDYACEYARCIFLEAKLSLESKRFLEQFRISRKLRDVDVTAVEKKIQQQLEMLTVLAVVDDRLEQALWVIVNNSLRTQSLDQKQEINWQSWVLPVFVGGVGCITFVFIAFTAFFALKQPAPPEIATQPSPLATPASEPNATSLPKPTPTQDKTSYSRDLFAQAGVRDSFSQVLLEDQETLTRLAPLGTDSNPQIDVVVQNIHDRLLKLAPATRAKLGTYTRNDYDQWQVELGQPRTGNKTLDSLTDARFHQLFPELRGTRLNPRTYGQIWFAIAEEQLVTAKAQLPRATPYQNKSFNRRLPPRQRGRRLPISVVQIAKLP